MPEPVVLAVMTSLAGDGLLSQSGANRARSPNDDNSLYKSVWVACEIEYKGSGVPDGLHHANRLATVLLFRPGL